MLLARPGLALSLQLTTTCFDHSESTSQSKRALATNWRIFGASECSEIEETLGRILDDELHLKYALLPLLPATSSTVRSLSHHSTNSIQESLVRVFVELPKLQSKLLLLLLEKLPEYEYRESDGIEENMPKLILGQFRWLPWIENSVALGEAFLNALSLANAVSLKRDIITWIPETADDVAVDVLVPPLVELMENDPELLAACLDTLSNLKLRDDHITAVQRSATDLLNSVDPENVHVLIKFLFHIVKAENLTRLFKDIRSKLKLETLGVSSAITSKHTSRGPGISSATGKDSNSAVDFATMLIECLKSGIRARHEVVTAFLQEFTSFSPPMSATNTAAQPRAPSGDGGAAATRNSSSTTPQQHSILDLWMIFLIHANLTNQRAKVELLLRKKIVSGQIKVQLLNRAISLHATALRDLFPTIIELAQILLQAAYLDSTSVLKKAAVGVYVSAFLHSGEDALLRQAILGQLMRHVSGPSHQEAHGALVAFDTLVSKHSNLMEPFASYLQGLIDFMDGSKLDNSLLLQVYFIFTKLGFPKGALSCSATETKSAQFLIMLIQKQLFNAETRYQKMGALGAIALICVLGAPTNPPASEEQLIPAMEKIKSTIDIGFEMHNPEAMELFLDALSRILLQRSNEHILRPEVVEYIALMTSSYVANVLDSRASMIELAKRRDPTPSKDGSLSTSSQLSDSAAGSPHSLLPRSIWCDIIDLLPPKHHAYEDIVSSALAFDLVTDHTASKMSPEKISTIGAMLRALLVSHQRAGSLDSVALCFAACLHLFPRPIAISVPHLHSFLNNQSQRPKIVEGMADQLIQAINLTHEFLNSLTQQHDLKLPDLPITSEDIIAARLKQLVQLEAYLDIVLDHIPDYPSSVSAETPLIHAADILREPSTTTARSANGGRGRKSTKSKPEFVPAGADEEEGEEENDEHVDGEDDESEKPDKPVPVVDTSTTASKSWGNTGTFDSAKYRRNINLTPVLSRIRPLDPTCTNALNFVSIEKMDTQMLWILLSTLLEKTTAIMPKKASINPAKQKPDPAWLRSYPDYLSCLLDMLPAYCALPRILQHLCTLSTAEKMDEDNTGLLNNGPGTFRSPHICSHLIYPCITVILQIFKQVFSSSLFYQETERQPGVTSSVARDVAKSLGASRQIEDTTLEIEWDSWTQLIQLCFAQIVKIMEVFTNFRASVAAVDLLRELASSILEDASHRANLEEQVSIAAGHLLDRYWTDSNDEANSVNTIFRTGQKYIPLEGLETLIQAHLGESAQSVVDRSQQLAKAMGEVVAQPNDPKGKNTESNADHEQHLTGMKTLTPATLPTFYRVVLTTINKSLVSKASPFTTEDLENAGGLGGVGEEDVALRMMGNLAGCLKIHAFLYRKVQLLLPEDRVLLGVSLRQGRAMVEAFQGKLEWVCSQVESSPMDAQTTVKLYQMATRVLQQLCTLVKERQYKQLGALVAPLKKAMEQVISQMRLLSDKHGFGDVLDVKVLNKSSATNHHQAGAKGGDPRPSAAPVRAEEDDGTEERDRNMKKRKRVQSEAVRDETREEDEEDGEEGGHDREPSTKRQVLA